MAILIQFLLRASFGLALAMAATSPRKVTSGYFRNHSYALLGFNVLAILATLALRESAAGASNLLTTAPVIAAAVLSYFSAVAWLYEKPPLGRFFLLAVSGLSLYGAWRAAAITYAPVSAKWVLAVLNAPTSGLLLGVTLAALFLGHWYLNSPSMELVPLNRLLVALLAALAIRAVVCAIGLLAVWATPDRPGLAFLALRWIAGLFGPAALTFMTMATMRIPNTQSATGILYVVLIGTQLGELLSLLLSQQTGYPL